ncbi:MAG: hypothetical protein KKF30_06290 [Proteobacteria bacterium]|nr:hypothetical protein [Pseudomonadota bacterium]MBU4471952.1 hypothetical protein [Pseudomonadota bacterium]
MILNDAGNMVQRQWLALPHRFQNIQLHEFMVMPNHFHGIVGVPLVGTRKDAPTQDVEMAYDRTTPKNGQPQGIAPTATTPNIERQPTAGKRRQIPDNPKLATTKVCLCKANSTL